MIAIGVGDHERIDAFDAPTPEHSGQRPTTGTGRAQAACVVHKTLSGWALHNNATAVPHGGHNRFQHRCPRKNKLMSRRTNQPHHHPERSYGSPSADAFEPFARQKKQRGQ